MCCGFIGYLISCDVAVVIAYFVVLLLIACVCFVSLLVVIVGLLFTTVYLFCFGIGYMCCLNVVCLVLRIVWLRFVYGC